MELFDISAHWVGKNILRVASGGRFTGKSGYQYGFAVLIGGAVLISPVVIFVSWTLLGSGN